MTETEEHISVKQLSKTIWDSLKDIRLHNHINDNYINIIVDNFNKQSSNVQNINVNEKEIEFLFYFKLFHEITKNQNSSQTKLIHFNDCDLYKSENDSMNSNIKMSMKSNKDFDYLDNEYDDYEKEIIEQKEQNQKKEESKIVAINKNRNNDIPLLTKKEISTKCSNDPIYNQILSLNLNDLSKFEHILDKNTYEKFIMLTDKTYTQSFDFVIYKTMYYELHLVKKVSNTKMISFQRKFLNCSDVSVKK